MRFSLALLMLMGCAKAAWVHSNKSEQDYYKDVYQCERDAAFVQGFLPKARMQDNCMKAQGWRQEER